MSGWKPFIVPAVPKKNTPGGRRRPLKDLAKDKPARAVDNLKWTFDKETMDMKVRMRIRRG